MMLVALFGALAIGLAPDHETLIFTGNSAFFALIYPTVGVVIASRQRDNAVGWLMLLIGLSFGLSSVAQIYAEAVPLGSRSSPPLAQWGEWINSWAWQPGWLSIYSFLLLLFPDGRPPSVSWNPIAGVTGIGLALTMTSSALHPDPGAAGGYQNPLPFQLTPAIAESVLLTGGTLAIAGMIGSVAALIFRFKRGRGIERQQLKWFTFAGIASVVLIPGNTVLSFHRAPLQLAAYVGVPLLPIAIGIAILRYRLYDIDHIINRTLVYGALTALLAAVYVSMVTAASALAASSEFLTASATLAVAALFQPLRRRLQTLIDRRFYRRRYDAARTVESFSARLRAEVDLDALTSELIGVVQTTMQPARVSLWLKEASR
jgi:hypothetical protein